MEDDATHVVGDWGVCWGSNVILISNSICAKIYYTLISAVTGKKTSSSTSSWGAPPASFWGCWKGMKWDLRLVTRLKQSVDLGILVLESVLLNFNYPASGKDGECLPRQERGKILANIPVEW